METYQIRPIANNISTVARMQGDYLGDKLFALHPSFILNVENVALKASDVFPQDTMNNALNVSASYFLYLVAHNLGGEIVQLEDQFAPGSPLIQFGSYFANPLYELYEMIKDIGPKGRLADYYAGLAHEVSTVKEAAPEQGTLTYLFSSERIPNVLVMRDYERKLYGKNKPILQSTAARLNSYS
jgi:hypothetical protein